MRHFPFLGLTFLATAVLAAGCGGAGSSPSSPSLQSGNMPSGLQPQAGARQLAVAPASAPTPIALKRWITYGQDDTFSPVDGDSASGGQGATIDGIVCDNPKPPYTYNVHAHISIFVNGKRIALPDAIGLMGPTPEKTGQTGATICFYHLHTHNASGIVDLESHESFQAFTLGQLFAVWGQSLSSTNIAGYNGTVKVYTARAKVPGNQNPTGPYSAYTGNIGDLPLVSLEEVVLEVGPTFVDPPNIPAIIFPTAV